MRPQCRTQAISLGEVLVATTLCLLLLNLLFKLFIPALKMWVEGQRRAEAGQQLALVCARMREDLAQSVPGSLSITEEQQLSMACQQQAADSYHLNTDLKVLYGCNEGELWRATTLGTDLQSLGPEQGPAWPKVAHKKAVVKGVKEWQVALPQPWQCSVRLKLESHGHSVTLLTTVSSFYAPSSNRNKGDSRPSEVSDWQLLYPIQDSGEST